MSTIRNSKIFAITVLLIALAACSGQSATTNSPSPSATSITGKQASKDFAKVMTASVNLATANGLTQTTTNSKYGVYVLVLDSGTSPKYQAAIKNPDGSINFVFDADSFVPFFAQERVNANDKILETGDKFTLTRMIEGSAQLYEFTISHGTIASETSTDLTGITVVSNLNYALPATSLAILKSASMH